MDYNSKSNSGRIKGSSPAFAKSDETSKSNDTPTFKNETGRARDTPNLDVHGTPENKRSGEDWTEVRCGKSKQNSNVTTADASLTTKTNYPPKVNDSLPFTAGKKHM